MASLTDYIFPFVNAAVASLLLGGVPEYFGYLLGFGGGIAIAISLGTAYFAYIGLGRIDVGAGAIETALNVATTGMLIAAGWHVVAGMFAATVIIDCTLYFFALK